MPDVFGAEIPRAVFHERTLPQDALLAEDLSDDARDRRFAGARRAQKAHVDTGTVELFVLYRHLDLCCDLTDAAGDLFHTDQFVQSVVTVLFDLFPRELRQVGGQDERRRIQRPRRFLLRVLRGFGQHHLLDHFFDGLEAVEAPVLLFGADAGKEGFRQPRVGGVAVFAHVVPHCLVQRDVMQRREGNGAQRQLVGDRGGDIVQRLPFEIRHAEDEDQLVLEGIEPPREAAQFVVLLAFKKVRNINADQGSVLVFGVVQPLDEIVNGGLSAARFLTDREFSVFRAFGTLVAENAHTHHKVGKRRDHRGVSAAGVDREKIVLLAYGGKSSARGELRDLERKVCDKIDVGGGAVVSFIDGAHQIRPVAARIGRRVYRQNARGVGKQRLPGAYHRVFGGVQADGVQFVNGEGETVGEQFGTRRSSDLRRQILEHLTFLFIVFIRVGVSEIRAH